MMTAIVHSWFLMIAILPYLSCATGKWQLAAAHADAARRHPHAIDRAVVRPVSEQVLDPQLHLPRAACHRVEDSSERRAGHRQRREAEARLVEHVGRVDP